jgi:TrmH family RNA methyltransferase
MAVVKQPQFDAPPSNWILAVDGVQDPGNLGTIIRTADWFGINTIVCSHETVDCFNPKVIQSTMGSIFRVHLDYTNLEEFLNQSELPIFGALMEGESVFNSSIPESGILVMGNEGNGISENLLPLINHPIHIPGRGQAESLNVAVATGILLGQLSR